MRKGHIVAFLVLGAFVLVLGPALSRTLTQPGDRAELKKKLPNPWDDPNQAQRHEEPVFQPQGEPQLVGLPLWFRDVDQDGDGRISIREWREADKNIDIFAEYDRDFDGFLTPEEIVFAILMPVELRLPNGQAYYHGAIEIVPEAPYQGRQTYKMFFVRLEAGKTYQIEQSSPTFPTRLFLEDTDGNVVREHIGNNVGEPSRIVYRVKETGTYRIVACSGGGQTGEFTLSVRVTSALDLLERGLPAWFKTLDKNKDGQVALHEWIAGGRDPGEFVEIDRNGDGTITAQEALHQLTQQLELKPQGGQLTFSGTVEEQLDERYQGKKSFKVLTVKLEAGRNYQFDLSSAAYQPYLYLEDPDGTRIGETNMGGLGGNVVLIHRATRTGTYRLIVTSQGGTRTGPFTLIVKVVVGGGALPRWFKELDREGTGQVTLAQWQAGGRTLDDFRIQDLNDDGVVTAGEVLHRQRQRMHLKFLGGLATYDGTVEETDQPYKGVVRSYSLLTVELEAGVNYQFEMAGKAPYRPVMVVEDPDNENNFVVQPQFDNTRTKVLATYRAVRSTTYRIIVFSFEGVKNGTFALSVRVMTKGTAVPQWFRDMDKDGAHQIALLQWQAAGRSEEEFRKFDKNGDGFVTADEVQQAVSKPVELRMADGEVTYTGTVEELSEERYKNKKSFRTLTVKLEAGKTYRIDQESKAFQSFIHLEEPDGKVVQEKGADGIGGKVYVVHKATKTGQHRIIATSLAGYRTGEFTLSVRHLVGIENLPPWFRQADLDGDGQIALYEWKELGWNLLDFFAADTNGDGILTAEELINPRGRSSDLALRDGHVTYQGNVEEQPPEQLYRGKKSYKALTVKLEAGKSYRIEHTSGAFQAFIHLEDPDGQVVAERWSDNIPGTAQVEHRATKSGTYRIIATSAGGFRTGPFTLTVTLTNAVADAGAPLPKDITALVKQLDRDGDGQIGLYEWKAAGRNADDFKKYDLNNDGFITLQELRRYLRE